ncbi:Cell differentiation protein Rcd1 [Spraguea lophii 42_110]|uniref:Cell differentiation protein Rcd1 n=1 Tax=Spraguea lophii (strain 42_110) TaxID=1358809 RepID=S7W8Q8_SPRLO|nr:Cell differentiation protein Rcd1 [Spraguea lophii 42_110]
MNNFEQLCENFIINRERFQYLEEISKLLLTDPERAQDIWCYGTMPLVLLDEVVKSYLVFDYKEIPEEEYNKAVMVLNVLQTLVEDRLVRREFIFTDFPIFILPFLNSRKFTRELESSRLAALGVIGTLVKDGDVDIINYLKDTDIVPLTLKTMDSGSEISKAISGYIFLKILQTRDGLESLTARFEKFMLICDVINSMITNAIKKSSKRILTPALQCLRKILDIKQVKRALKSEIPPFLKDLQIKELLRNDANMLSVYDEIIDILNN